MYIQIFIQKKCCFCGRNDRPKYTKPVGFLGKDIPLWQPKPSLDNIYIAAPYYATASLACHPCMVKNKAEQGTILHKSVIYKEWYNDKSSKIPFPQSFHFDKYKVVVPMEPTKILKSYRTEHLNKHPPLMKISKKHTNF